jgi:hypothetical protein
MRCAIVDAKAVWSVLFTSTQMDGYLGFSATTAYSRCCHHVQGPEATGRCLGSLWGLLHSCFSLHWKVLRLVVLQVALCQHTVGWLSQQSRTDSATAYSRCCHHVQGPEALVQGSSAVSAAAGRLRARDRIRPGGAHQGRCAFAG